ncbi:uncharacterized protein LOC110027771 [Phalaenopsis equestris]|uniref:uncharacterized protein LOC110027771 n=1 Tax=Phalaenopsis equestris TaxID=78828 RepID=UPI0009E28A23|nr:uncharacterized protein LOC110027771 [Phalaenopsis equestris]
MVIAAEAESRIRREPSAMAENRTSPSTSKSGGSNSRLHNFSLPSLGWRNQRLLRCVNLSSGSTAEVIEPAMRRSLSPSLDETRQSAPSPLRKPLRIRGQKRRIHGEEDEESTPAAAVSLRPWNLRTRRPPCNAPGEIGQNSNPSSPRSPSPSLISSPLNQEKIINPVRMLRSRSKGFEKAERRKFSIPLSKVEIEEDFVVMKGTKPLRRPKKRARYLQRQLDALFPGSLLTEVSPDLYKIEVKRS